MRSSATTSRARHRRSSTSLGILLAFVEPWLALVPYAAVALMWLVPDRRVERYLAEHQQSIGD